MGHLILWDYAHYSVQASQHLGQLMAGMGWIPDVGSLSAGREPISKDANEPKAR